MRGVGTGGDGVEFAAYYFLGKTEGAQSLGIWDASISEVEVEVGGEESRGLSSKTEQGELVEVGSKVRGRGEEVRAFQVFVGDVYIGSQSPYGLAGALRDLAV